MHLLHLYANVDYICDKFFMQMFALVFLMALKSMEENVLLNRKILCKL